MDDGDESHKWSLLRRSKAQNVSDTDLTLGTNWGLERNEDTSETSTHWIDKPIDWLRRLKSKSHHRVISASADALDIHGLPSATSASGPVPSMVSGDSVIRWPGLQSPQPQAVDQYIVFGPLADASVAVDGMKLSAEGVEGWATVPGKFEGTINFSSSVSSFLSSLSEFNTLVDKISTIHPYVQAAWTVLSAVSKIIIAQVDRDKSIQHLFEKMKEVYTFLNDAGLEKIQSMKPLTQRICQQTLECSYFIQAYAQNHAFRKRLLNNLTSDTDKRVRDFQNAFEDLQQQFRDEAARDTLLVVHRIWSEVKLVKDIIEDVDLNSMPYAQGAGLNLQKVCLEGTREAILQEIMDWASSIEDSSRRVFWLHGNAGTGKSSIAHTIAHRFQKMERLGSCFCFDRNESAQGRHQQIFTTIARDLSDRDKQMREALASIVHQNTSLRNTTDILQQWTELILKPVRKLSDAMAGPIVIVIDALDESGEPASRELLLRILSGKMADEESQIQHLPPNVRILLTSRPLPDIHKVLSQAAHVQVRSMDSISRPSTEADILSYIKDKLSDRTWLTEWDLRTLATASDGLFEWARLACTYINNDNDAGLTQQERFQLATARDESMPLLDGMYKLTLEAIFPGADKDSPILGRFKSVMAQIVRTAEPLTIISLTAMRRRFPDHILSMIDINVIVRPMGALLSGTTSSTSVIRPLHASFVDFLMDERRSGKFFVGVSDIDKELASSCLDFMQAELKFNICKLPSSYLSNSQVSDYDERVKQNISPELSYSCRFWMDHLHHADLQRSLAESVRNFFQKESLLFWLEVLSLLRRISTCYESLSRVIEWARHDPEWSDIVEDAADAQRFVRMFGPAISFSTPHLYVSAMQFSPRNSRISKKFRERFRRVLTITQGRHTSWPVVQGVFHGHNSAITSASFSPDNRKIVSGTANSTVQIWDAETGERLGPPMLGHRHLVESVAFSPDGKKVGSASYDRTIRLWDVETAALLIALEGHNGPVCSIAFSSDGGQIVSGSEDKTIRIWSTDTGKELQAPFEGHQGAIISVALSPDGQQIASGSDDKTIRLWDTKGGKELRPHLEGHSDCIRAIVFSPDGDLLVSGSDDKTVRIWDVETREQRGAPLIGHGSSIQSVAFSPDGSRIISGSMDKTILQWNVKTRVQLGPPLRGHTGPVSSVSFSSDGMRILSSSFDKTIRLWDAETEEQHWQLQVGHDAPILAVAISPDDSKIASGSDDRTVRLWDTHTGEQLQESLREHDDIVWSVAFSPDGRHLASASSDRTIRQWDATNGKAFQMPLRGHDHAVLTVRYSPDGKLLVSGSADNTIRLWNAKTGDQVGLPLEGHDEQIWSVSFSPDGEKLVSGSSDKTVRFWDVKTGQQLGLPLKGHRETINCVAFSPQGDRVVSGSNDTEIIVWNVDTREQQGLPIDKHTDHVISVAFSPDGRRIVSASSDKTIRLWNADTGQPLQIILTGHSAPISSLAVSLDGSKIVSGSDDKTIRVWDASAEGKLHVEQPEVQPRDGQAVESKQYLVCLSTTCDHSLRQDLDGATSSPFLLADSVEVDSQDWTRLHVGGRSELLFWSPPSYQPVWLHQWLLRVIPAPQVQIDLSNMAHGLTWHLCYDSANEEHT